MDIKGLIKTAAAAAISFTMAACSNVSSDATCSQDGNGNLFKKDKNGVESSLGPDGDAYEVNKQQTKCQPTSPGGGVKSFPFVPGR